MRLDATVQDPVVCGCLTNALILDELEASVSLSAGAIVGGEYRLMRYRVPSAIVLGVGELSDQAFFVPNQIQFGLIADGGKVRTLMEMLSGVPGCVPVVKVVDRTKV